MYRKMTILFITFSLPFFVAVFLLAFEKSFAPSEKVFQIAPLGFWEIFRTNFVVCSSLVLLGYISRYFSYFLFYMNAIFFSFYFILVEDLTQSIARLWRYGFTEVLALSISCYVGIRIKTLSKKEGAKLLIVVVLLLALSAFLESQAV